jgi:hypothetical protein
MGGQNPVSGSTIQIYTVGTTGDGSPSSALIGATLTTSDGSNTNPNIANNSNANAGNLNNTLPLGSFTIPSGAYTCNPSTEEVYIVSTGGNPGLGTGVNPNLALMTALGPCNTIGPSTFITINELTTVSSLAALGGFETTYSEIGFNGSADQSQLVAQALEVPKYTTISNGTVPGAALPAGYSASSTAIQTLADIVAACVNSAGGTAGDTTPCGNLFHLAKIGSSAPTNTIDAVINIVQDQPTVNVSQIFQLLPGTGNPFQPTLTSAPPNWLLPITSNTATQLVFTVGPTNTAQNSSMTPAVVVSIEDSGNNVQTSATNTITLAIGANPGGSILNGTTNPTTAIAINGVATFTGLTLNKTGTGYTFTATASGLTTATSGTFNITP